MMRTPEKRNPGWRAGASGMPAGERRFHVQNATAEPLLQRLEAVRRVKDGSWIARCPAHKDRSPSLSVTETGDRVLVHCHAGCRTADVLDSVGLAFADLFPPRHWPESPQERRQAARAAREAAMVAALPQLAHAAAVVHIAAAKLLKDQPLDWDDYCTLVAAEEVIGNARSFFCDRPKLEVVR